jgi:hypothetical protein
MAMSGPYSGFLGSAGCQISQDERNLQMFLTDPKKPSMILVLRRPLFC